MNSKPVNKGGRVAIDGAQDLRAKSVMLDKTTIRTLKALGGGNLSAGIRAAAKLPQPRVRGK